jgi:hypothetical protein
VAAGSLLLADGAVAGTSTLRLNGGYSMQDENAGADNQACLVADFTTFFVGGEVTGTTDGCTVFVGWQAFVPNKTSASVLKDDGTGTAKISQQVEAEIDVAISGGECATAPYVGTVQPEKCKVSSSVNATEGPDTTQKGKASVTCELGSEGSELVPSPTTAQVDTVVAAFADRNDVNISDSGKVTIKLKGEQGSFCF